MRSLRCTIAPLCALALVLPSTAAASGAAAGTPIPGHYIVVLKSAESGQLVAADHEHLLGALVSHIYDHALHGYAAELSQTELALVKADPRVAYVSQDRGGVAIQSQTLPTGVNRTDADLSSQLAGDGSGTTPGDIAVFDTGIQPDHPDLNVAGGVDCLGGYSGDDGTWYDANGHGTHVAGIVGAKDDLNGTVGVAPGVRLWAVRTLNVLGSGSAATQLCGIDWVTANAPGMGIKVANSSQILFASGDDGNCGYTNNDPLHQAICRSTAAGILWVFGAGNNAVDLAGAAGASFDEVLAVTAMGDGNGQPNVGSTDTFTCLGPPNGKKRSNYTPETDDKYTSFSAYAVSGADQAHTIAAPGACIYSTYKGSGYENMSGTSMSGPHAAAVAHLCYVSGQCAGTPAETIQKLRTDAAAYAQANPGWGFTGDPLNSPVAGRYYGYLVRAGQY
ncbi:MAG TPA: S8 family serine peptidase [Thermoleophilaceae bacterium]|jgi:subtilisin family serine protease